MLLTVDDPNEGFAAAERLHSDVGKALAVLPYTVSASMGAVVVHRAAPGDEEGFMRRADELMYEVKRAGRNALRIAEVHRAAPTVREREAA